MPAFFPNHTATVHGPTVTPSYGVNATTWPTPPNPSLGSFEIDAQPAGDEIRASAGIDARAKAYEVFGPVTMPVEPENHRIAWGGRQHRIVLSEVWNTYAWALVEDAGPTEAP